MKTFHPLALALFALLVSAPSQVAQDTFAGAERIVAIGDVHGDYEQFLAVLKDAGVADDRGRWKGGKTHLVQTGDVPDRGPQTRKIMDMLMRLEGQARKAGGYVHCLIGNHEAMNLYGDLRYATPEEFAAFRDGNSSQIRDAFYEQEIEELKKNPPPAGLPQFDGAHRRKWDEEHPLGYFEHRFGYGPKGKYGKWVREHNAAVKIGDTLFMHGGISPKYASFSLAQINEAVRSELTDFSKLKDGIVMDEEGPLWYRGLARDDEEKLAAHLQAILQSHGVQRIAIGHTPTAGTVLPRFGGKVLLIDVGLSKAYGARRACLVIEKGAAATLHRGTRIALPEDAGEAFLAYVRKAAALDPPPSPLQALLEQPSMLTPTSAP